MGWRFVFILICLSTLACAPTGRVRNFKVSDQFTHEEYQIIKHATNVWNLAAKRRTQLEYVIKIDGWYHDVNETFTKDALGDGHDIIYKISSKMTIFQEMMKNHHRIIGKLDPRLVIQGYTFDDDIVLVTDLFDPNVPESNMLFVTAHEYGHAIGINGHFSDPTNLMAESMIFGGEPKLSVADEQVFCDLFECVR